MVWQKRRYQDFESNLISYFLSKRFLLRNHLVIEMQASRTIRIFDNRFAFIEVCLHPEALDNNLSNSHSAIHTGVND